MGLPVWGTASFGFFIATSEKQFVEKAVAGNTAEIKPIADAASVSMADQLKGEGKATYTELEKLSGPIFDRNYISDMAKDHRKSRGRVSKKSKARLKTHKLTEADCSDASPSH